MTTVFVNISDQPWGLGGAIFSNRETATKRASEVANILYPLKIEEDKYRERRQEAIDEIVEEMLIDTKYVDRDDFYQSNHKEIDKKAETIVLEDLAEALWESLNQIIIEEADSIEIHHVKMIATRLGWPSEKVERAVNLREQELDWVRDADTFYANAQISNTIVRGGKGTAKMVQKYDRLIRMRYYKDDKKETRKTVEIEEPGGPRTNIMTYTLSGCADYRLPDIAMASDHYIMFRCPDGCDQNASIQFVGIEGYWEEAEEEGVLTFNLSCPKCGKSYRYNILFGPFDCHTAYGFNWKKQVEYFKSVRPRSRRQ